MKKLKTKIVRVSILGLSFILMFVCIILLSSKKVSASSIPLDFIEYELVDTSDIDDLPFLPDSNSNGFNINKWVFGYYYYNQKPCYFLVLFPNYNSSGVPIIYQSYSDANSVNDELEDGEYYPLQSQVLSDSADTIQDILVDSGYRISVLDNFYLQLNYYGLVAYGTYHNANLRCYLPNAEYGYSYSRNFGYFNTAFYQELFYQLMMDNISDNDLIDVRTTRAYQRGVKYGKESNQAVIDSKNALIVEKDDIIADLREQLLNANNNFADFRNLLSAIFMYPVHFFTEGLDVNIFGINLGDFLLGLFMITILFTVFKFILGKRF